MSSGPMPEAVLIYKALSRRAVDGDTIEVTPNRPIRVRLLGVDTPERGQPGFTEATTAAQQFLNGATGLRISTARNDNFGRELAWVWDEGTGESLNDHMLAFGTPVSAFVQIKRALAGEMV